VPQFPSVASVISCNSFGCGDAAPFASPTACFCPSISDKNPMSANPTSAAGSITAVAICKLRASPKTNRKTIEKCASQNQYSLRFVSSRKPVVRRFPLRLPRGCDKTTHFCRLSAIFSFSRQNCRTVIPRSKPHSCNPIAKTKFRRVHPPTHSLAHLPAPRSPPLTPHLLPTPPTHSPGSCRR